MNPEYNAPPAPTKTPPLKVMKEIVAASVVAPQAPQAPQTSAAMHEALPRPEVLSGATYKIKTPLSDHALYVTINNLVLDADTPREATHPFEIFLNSKAMEHFQWIVALTRTLSATFRKGGDLAFLVEELKAVHDPKGGYFKKGRYLPSLVAEIGDVIERHLQAIGRLPKPELDPRLHAALVEKRRAYEAAATLAEDAGDGDGFPPEAMLCGKCQMKAVVVLDGCFTCLSCGDSRCG